MDKSIANLTPSVESGLQAHLPLTNSGARWIHRNELRIGMIVNDLDRPWDESLHFHAGFRIDSQESLLFIQDACEYVSIIDQ